MDLFHRYHSKYYGLVRQRYQEGLLEPGQEENRKKSALQARETLFHYDIYHLQLYRPEYCFSSLVEEVDLPWLFTHNQRRYLKTLLTEPVFVEFIGEEGEKALQNYLSDDNPFPKGDFIRDMSRKTQENPPTDPKMIHTLYHAILQKKMLHFGYHGTNGLHHAPQNYFPYRLLYDKERHIWQLVAFPVQKADSHFEVICNLSRIEELTVTEEVFSQDWGASCRHNRENQVLSLGLRPDYNSIERCFLLLQDYESNSYYDSQAQEYILEVQYHPAWEREDLCSKILSLGMAVEVLSPPDFQEAVKEEVRSMWEG